MKIIQRAAFCTAVLVGAAISPSTAFELQHSEGILSLPSAPGKVVSFDLAILDTLAALDIPAAGVPKSVYEGPLSRYRDTPVIGTLFEPDYAALRLIQPDLIVASSRSQKAVPELQQVAPTVNFSSDPRAFMMSFHDATRAIAKSFGREKEASIALAAIDNNTEALQRMNRGKTAAMLFTVNGNVIAHAPGDRFGYAYELTGTTSVLPPKKADIPVAARPEAGSPEAQAIAEARAQAVAAVVAAEPDWLLVLDRGAINGGKKTAADILADHPLLSRTRAYEENRVVYLDPNGWYVVGGGLNNMRNITEGLLAEMK